MFDFLLTDKSNNFALNKEFKSKILVVIHIKFDAFYSWQLQKNAFRSSGDQTGAHNYIWK